MKQSSQPIHSFFLIFFIVPIIVAGVLEIIHSFLVSKKTPTIHAHIHTYERFRVFIEPNMFSNVCHLIRSTFS